jgi:tripartite-type tricarboxylate transporter receptor subunit TctC
VLPAGVNKEIAAKLHATTSRALQQPDVKEIMAQVGAEIVGNTPEEFTAFIRNERAKYAKVIRDANIKLE